MRCFAVLSLLAVFFALVIAMEPSMAAPPAAQKLVVEDSRLLDLIARRQNLIASPQQPLIRVTREPHTMPPVVAQLCAAASSDVERDTEGPHRDFSVHVYVTKDGREMLATGKGVYPAGSTIIKEKLSHPGEPVPDKLSHPGEPVPAGGSAAYATKNALPPKQYTTELFTGMLKREAGYNPECGDWEFFIVDGDAKKLLGRGKIDSCMACHQDYKDTDFVTRAYMPKK